MPEGNLPAEANGGQGRRKVRAVRSANERARASAKVEGVEQELEGLVGLSTMLGPEAEEHHTPLSQPGFDQRCFPSHLLLSLGIAAHQQVLWRIAPHDPHAGCSFVHLENRAPAVEHGAL